MDVERVDFVSFLTEDIPRENDMEFRAGQVTLDIFSPAFDRPAVRAEPGGGGAARPRRGRRPRRARGEGVQFDGETVETVCHMAFFKYPDGNALMLHRRYAPFADGRQP